MRPTTSRLLQSAMLIGILAVLITSCNDVAFNSTQPQNGHMDFLLTDAPGDFQEVNVDVQGLQIHFAPSSTDTVSTDTTDGEWIELPVEPFRVNLLDLSGDIDTLISSADLEPGHYSQLRLMLGHDNDVMVDSVIHELTVPSGQETGYKIQLNADLEAGEELDITVDFDAEKSVHKAGQSGMYILKPVLKAFSEVG